VAPKPAIDCLGLRAVIFDPCEVLARRNASDDPIRPGRERGLIDDGVVDLLRDALLLAPVLREDVVNVDVLIEEDGVAEGLA